jgi:hypothetical protein
MAPVTEPKRILKVSITELLEFLRCRRAWDFESANRQSLVRRGVPHTALWMGTAVHVALAAGIDGDNPMEALEAYIQTQRKEMGEDYLRRVGAPMSTQEWISFDESAKLCRDVVQRYFEHYGSVKNPFWHRHKLTPIAAELTFLIPLPNIAAASGYYDEVYLVGTIDAVLLNELGQLGAGDNKTYSQSVDVRDLQRDFQFTGYCACLQRLTGEQVHFFVYNGLNKKIPTKPKVLTGEGPRKGKLSKAKDIVTDAPTYRQAVIDNGEDPKDYADHLAWLELRDREQNAFFVRHKLTISQAQMADWWTNMLDIVQEIADEPTITYNRRWEGCWDCNVRDLCDTIMDGGDVEWVRTTSYTIGTYGTQQTLTNTVSPETVSNLQDLIRFAQERIQNR